MLPVSLLPAGKDVSAVSLGSGKQRIQRLRFKIQHFFQKYLERFLLFSVELPGADIQPDCGVMVRQIIFEVVVPEDIILPPFGGGVTPQIIWFHEIQRLFKHFAYQYTSFIS